MGIRDFLREGALALGLAGIIASVSCSTSTDYIWQKRGTEISIEKSKKDITGYKITDVSYSPLRDYSISLKFAVNKNLIEEAYETRIEEVTEEEHKRVWTKEYHAPKSLLELPFHLLDRPIRDSAKIDPTGETRVKTNREQPKKINEKIIKTSPASAIPIEVRGEFSKYVTGGANDKFLLETKTGKDGALKVEIKIPQEDNMFLNKEDLKRAHWKNIKEPAESFITKYLINHINDAAGGIEDYNISIETKVQNAKNDVKYVHLATTRWRINSSMLEEAVKQFVEEEFNSKIKKASITLLDYESHTPITLTKDDRESYNPAKIVLEPIKVSSKEDLMKPYFEGKYLQIALATLKDYITTKSEISIDVERGEASFYVYHPSDFKVKITHQKYHHISDEIIGFSKDSLDKEVYMSKIGKKVDLKIVDKEPKSKIKDKK